MKKSKKSNYKDASDKPDQKFKDGKLKLKNDKDFNNAQTIVGAISNAYTNCAIPTEELKQ